MRVIKMCLVMGTRPEVIKLAPIIHLLKKQPHIQTIIISTGQHREMLDQMLKVFEITADYELNLMQPGQTLSDITNKLLETLDPIFKKEKPDVVLTQGDTTSAFAGSLVAFYNRIPVGHIEAGLRSHCKGAPYPEEANRKMITTLCDWSFAPTEESFENLIKENIPQSSIFKVGNTVVDALQYIIKYRPSSETIVSRDLLAGKKLILLTAHRRENFGNGFQNICHALRRIANENQNIKIVYPVHMNPNIKDTAHTILHNHPNISLIPPVNYVDFIHLLKRAHFVLTDSGGIQEEAPVLGKPVLVLRDVTERPEGVKAGVAKLVGTNQEMIVSEATKLLCDTDYYKGMAKPQLLYGDGRASERIVNILSEQIGRSPVRTL